MVPATRIPLLYVRKMDRRVAKVGVRMKLTTGSNQARKHQETQQKVEQMDRLARTQSGTDLWIFPVRDLFAPTVRIYRT